MTEGRRSLVELEMRGDFIRRHIGPGDPQIAEMLQDLSLESLDDLVDRAVPSSIVLDQPLDLPEPKSERAALSYLRRMAERNQVFISMIGMGYYGTVTPKVIQRNVLENPSWYTAYTPYQAEVSQGRLEALLESIHAAYPAVVVFGLALHIFDHFGMGKNQEALVREPLDHKIGQCFGLHHAIDGS